MYCTFTHGVPRLSCGPQPLWNRVFASSTLMALRRKRKNGGDIGALGVSS